MMKWNEI